MRRVSIALGLAVACTIFHGDHTQAQSYPVKPVRMVLPFPPGGGTDALARITGPRLSEALGQPVVVDNRPGAAGNIAAEIVARAAPDGYTLLLAFATVLTANPHLYRNAGFDSERDFDPVVQIAVAQFMLVVHPSVPAKSVADLVALGKAKPGSLHYGSSGPGSPLHLAAELFKSRTGVDIVHVPYKGGAPAAAALLGGEIQVLFGSFASTFPHVKSGRLRALAVTGLQRANLAPNLPTLAESGYPGFNVQGWDAVMVPSGTARSVVTRLNGEITKVLQLPEVRGQIANVGYEVTATPPAELAKMIRNESQIWSKVIRDAGIRAD